MKRLRKLPFFFSWFFFLVSLMTVIPLQANSAEKKEKNELTLSESTVEGDVIEAMKIDLINLQKNRRENIGRQLEKTIVVRKQFLKERPQEQTENREPDQ